MTSPNFVGWFVEQLNLPFILWISLHRQNRFSAGRIGVICKLKLLIVAEVRFATLRIVPAVGAYSYDVTHISASVCGNGMISVYASIEYDDRCSSISQSLHCMVQPFIS